MPKRDRRGYVAADMMITMVNGIPKQAKDIQTGDRIRGGGTPMRVSEILTVYADEICSLTTYEGYRLKATCFFRVCTSKGFVSISDLDIMNDVILTESGEQPVAHLRKEKYGGVVYSFVLEPPDPVICGGIISGGFGRQAEKPGGTARVK